MKLITLNSSCKSKDQEIPDSIRPTIPHAFWGLINPALYLRLNIHTECQFKSQIRFLQLFFRFKRQNVLPPVPSASLRLLDMLLKLYFFFTFPAISGIRASNEIVKLIVVNCDGSEKIVYYNVGSSTTFENVLNSGDSDCNYQVTVIFRAILEEEYKESNFTISVLLSSKPVTTVIESVLSLATNSTSYKTKLSILSSISLSSVAEERVEAKFDIDTFYQMIIEMDAERSGVFSRLEESEQFQFMNFSLNIFEQNIVENINLTLQDSIEQKTLEYVSTRIDNFFKANKLQNILLKIVII